MRRREFLATAAAISAGGWATSWAHDDHQAACHPTYASPAEAMKSPPERFAFVTATYNRTPTDAPDYLASVDVDPQSPTYSQVVSRVEMPTPGDELHHFGWNACSSCHGDAQHERRYLIVPGLLSGRIHIIDARDPGDLKMHKVIEPAEIIERVNLSTPHTVHCLPDGQILISMLGDKQGNAPGGYLLLDDEFNIVGRWDQGQRRQNFGYDFWYQPRHNVMVSSGWAAPKTFQPGFDLEDVKAGLYGHHLNFWDWHRRELIQSIDLGEKGLIPLEVRFHHDPASTHGFVGAALSSVVWHWHFDGTKWRAEPVIEVPSVEIESWPIPVPGLVTDLLVSLDDRWLYFVNWLHGDVRQYDISDPSQPQLTGQLWCGGVIGHASDVQDRKLAGGPQMLQLSLDGRRLYVTNSLYSSWDNQFYPEIAQQGSYMLQIDCDTQRGGMRINPKFHVDFGQEPHGPARAHEVRFPGGDSTSDIWV